MKNRTTLLLFCLLFSFGQALAQPANDGCSGATNIGTLPTPGACVSGLQNGAVITLTNQTTVGATSPNPYVYQTQCQGTGNMTTFALDTWYVFTATGTTVNVSITGFTNVQMALYTGTCANLQGLGCSTSGTMVVTQTVAGQTYYLQITGNTTTATDNSFSIAIDNDIDCNDCMLGSTLTATPAPVNGGYTPGQVVNFCFTVTNFSEVNTNWLHGVQISMGPGWTGVVSSPVPAADCNVDVTAGPGNAGAGSWAWYPSGVTSSANGSVWPAGFYFDNSNVGGTNAGNNFGDPGNCGWTFCWSQTVSSGCSNGANLNVNVNTSGDGESGSWSSLGCVDDPPTIFSAVELCCSATASNTGPYCAGQTIQLNGTGGGTYSWTGPNGFTSSLQNPTLPATVAAVGVYTLSINNLGCITTATTTVGSSPLPTVNAGNDVSVCQNQSTTLTATGASTYTWSPVINNGVAFTPSTTGTYTVTGTTAAGCVNTDQVTVSVNPLPTINAGVDQTVCIGTQVTLTASGAATYTWSPLITNGTAFAPPSGTTVYTVTGTSAAGCISTDAVQVVSSSSPSVNAGTYTPVCINAGPLVLVGTPVGGTFSGNGVIGTTFNPASGTQTVTYNYTDANGCSGSGTATITVNLLPTIAGGADASVCAGQTTTLTASGAVNYSWSPAATNGTAFVPPGTATYTVTGTSATGCTSSDQVLITVNPLPIVNAGLDQTVCIGTQVTLTASGAATYTWSPLITNGTAFAPPSGTTVYTVTGTSAAGCISTDAVQVTSYSSPPVSAGTYAPICINAGPVALAGTPVGGTFSGNGVVGTTFNPASGTQTVTYNYTDANGCSGSGTATITVNPLPIVDAGTYTPICADASNLPLVGTPAGGTFSGTGVTANAFDPSVNTQTVSYTYTNANGCVNTDVTTITVIQPTPSNAGTYIPVCIDASNVVLNGTPASGTFTGTGVTAGMFDPSVGTQTVTYTYSNATGCTTSATATIVVNPLPTVGAGSAQVICEGNTVILNGTGAVTYTWSDGALNGQAFTPSIGQNAYTVTGTDANGCIASASVNVNVLPSPIALVTSDVQTGNPVLDVNFVNGSQFGTTYTWDFGNDNTYTSNLTDSTNQLYAVPGTYIVTLIASNGLCASIDSLDIIVVPFNGPEVEVPNVFSPNADDANDIFFLTHLYTEKIYIVILNRWGEVVFETTDENPQWDGSAQNGRPVKDGVYFYKYVATGINGTELKGHGNITVVR